MIGIPGVAENMVHLQMNSGPVAYSQNTGSVDHRKGHKHLEFSPKSNTKEKVVQ